jgi:hypothetical protein
MKDVHVVTLIAALGIIGVSLFGLPYEPLLKGKGSVCGPSDCTLHVPKDEYSYDSNDYSSDYGEFPKK